MRHFPALLIIPATLMLTLVSVIAGEAPPAPGEHNVALLKLGATAKGSGQKFNKDWPPNNALVPGLGRGGTMFGGPLIGGRVDIALLVPVDIIAIEVVPLDYNGTVQPKGIEIFIDGKSALKAELPNTPGKPIRVPLTARGQKVGILVTDEYPPTVKMKNGNMLNWGGWARLRVISTTNLPDMTRPVDGYTVAVNAAHIAPTSGAAVTGKVEVVGEPRQTKGHPCTWWDKEDIAHYQAMLKTSVELQTQFAGLKKAMDTRITQPIDVPPATKDAEGKWQHFSDLAPYNKGTYGSTHNQLSLDVANLGVMYALTGEEKYGEFAKKIMLAYGDNYPNYAMGARPGFNHSPSKAFDQILSDAIWILPVVRGYDLIHDLPSITAEERTRIEGDFLGGVAKLVISNHAMLEAPTNWSAIGTCAVLAIGYATDNQGFIDTAMYGIKGTDKKPTGGLLDRHFGSKAIAADGMWGEGAMGYQFMALQALISDAEILWHHGIDMYRYRDCALKRLFDSPLEYAYPNLRTPAIHDSGYGSIVGGDSYLYEFAYRRYRDPAHLLVLNQTGRQLGATFQQFTVSVLYDHDSTQKVKPVECKSVNLFGVGYGVLRTTSATGTNSLLMDYGPNGSHGHPDKLNIDLYAFDERLIPDPGSVWYEQPLYKQWYHSSLAHNTLVVDELDQVMADATQLVYGPAATMGMQRAWTREACPGVTMDRAVFLTPHYLADLFGAFTRLPRKMDLAWHIRGEFASELKMTSMAFPQPAEFGYMELTNVRHVETNAAWTATMTREGHAARFVAAGGTPTDVIVADGLLGLEKPPTILQRRIAAGTLYGNAVDISGAKEPYVKGVRQEGGNEVGYGLLEVQTVRGSDLCFSAFRPGTHKAGGLETDAQQAFVMRDGNTVRALYLGGGTRLAVDGVVLQRSESGLAYLELMDNGAYVLANPSATDATITIVHPGLAGLQAFALDPQGRRGAAPSISKGDGGGLVVTLKASAQIELAAAGVISMYDARQAVLAKRQAEQEAALVQAKNACSERTAKRVAEAQAKPAPAGTVVAINATAMSGQGGGTVKITDKKRAIVGKAFSSWDALGHWLEWKFTVPADGYYNLTVCYCSQDKVAERIITINGEEQEPFAPLLLPGTGGWANGSDDWRLGTAINPTNEKPLLLKLKSGENVIRLTNSNGNGANFNYVAITSPDVAVSRELLGGKVPPEVPAPAPTP
ncbi:MAG: heparinase II/III family protein [Planctomycetota bacterium]